MGIHAIIVAAGAGRRFGGRKQFILVRGRPLFLYAASVFQKHEKIDAITLVVPKSKIMITKKLVKDYRLQKVRSVVAGGKRRQDSVASGLRTVKGRSGMVVIHDAARPLVAKSMLSRGIAMCRKHKAVILAIRVSDTVKRVVKRRVQDTVPREDLFLVQTPQFYDLRTIRNALKQADFRIEYTDESAILESIGRPVYVCQGDPLNMKVTDRRDLRIIEKILS